MALVDYSSSEEAEEDVHPTNDPTNDPTPNVTLKRERVDESASDLPPLPSKFHDLYASTARIGTTDDPSLHGGRKRVTPHVEGNWPTHIYIEWYPSTTEHNSLHALISGLKTEVTAETAFKINSFLTSDLGAPLPLHISLSQPIGFVTDRKDGFVSSLEQSVKSSGIRPFDVSFVSLDWVPNFEKTRWFLVLRLAKPDANGLNKLLHISNKVVQEYGQPPLYISSIPVNERVVKKLTQSRRNNGKSARSTNTDWSTIHDVSDVFHISIAWTLEPPSEQVLKITKSLKSNQIAKMEQIQFRIEEIKAKVGNVVTNMPLPTSAIEEQGLFGF